MKGVLFVVTGFADNTTPGDSDSNNMTWTTINQLATNGRWQISFHAGQYGHGDAYAGGAVRNEHDDDAPAASAGSG